MSVPLRGLAGLLLACSLVPSASAAGAETPLAQAPEKPQKPAALPVTPAAAPGQAKDKEKEKEPEPGKGGLSVPRDDPFPSTYKVPAAPPFAIRNATILTAAGPVIRSGTVLVRDGKIVAEIGRAHV